MTDILIVDKNANIKETKIKDFTEEELYKKCSFKKQDGFKKQTEWNVKIGPQKYLIHLFAKTDGKANTENKYDFPPPVDTQLFFGNVALVGYKKEEDQSSSFVSLTTDLWEKIYEKLFGGFEDLKMTLYEDEEEEDELANVPAERKTKQGYLKDGFVVDSDSLEDEDEYYDSDDYDDDDDMRKQDKNQDEDDDEESINLDIGSELSEESYDYSEDDGDEDDDKDEDKDKKNK